MTKNYKFLFTTSLCLITLLLMACSEESIKAWDTSKKSTDNPIILRASVGTTIEQLDLFNIPEETSFSDISTYQTKYKTITDKITDKLKQDYNKTKLQESYDTARETLKGKELLLLSELEQELDLFLQKNKLDSFDEETYKRLKNNHSKLNSFIFLDAETKERLTTLMNNTTMLHLSWVSSVKTEKLKQITLENVTKENKNETLKDYKTLPTLESILKDSQPYDETTRFNPYKRQLNNELKKLERISKKINVVSLKYDREEDIDKTIQLLTKFSLSIPTQSEKIPTQTSKAPQKTSSKLKTQQQSYNTLTEKTHNKLRYNYRKKELSNAYNAATQLLRTAELQDSQDLDQKISQYLEETQIEKIDPKDYTEISDHYEALTLYPTLTEKDLKKLNIDYRNASIRHLTWETHEKIELYSSLETIGDSKLTLTLITQAINSEPTLTTLDTTLSGYALISSKNPYKQELETYAKKLQEHEVKLEKLKQKIKTNSL